MIVLRKTISDSKKKLLSIFQAKSFAILDRPRYSRIASTMQYYSVRFRNFCHTNFLRFVLFFSFPVRYAIDQCILDENSARNLS